MQIMSETLTRGCSSDQKRRHCPILKSASRNGSILYQPNEASYKRPLLSGKDFRGIRSNFGICSKSSGHYHHSSSNEGGS